MFVREKRGNAKKRSKVQIAKIERRRKRIKFTIGEGNLCKRVNNFEFLFLIEFFLTMYRRD